MPFRIFEHWERCQHEFGIICMALLGGLVRVANRPKCGCVERPSVWASLLTSVFAGLIMMHLLSAATIADSYKGAIVGMTGWLSTEVLDILKKIVLALVKKIGEKISGGKPG